ncbi:LysR substrate-binding domain-containing protein [Flaviflagellibacter deserti]|jgi:DNA-binding transcriptional LysR family regulator|uniref:LysR substrate-binding domain-containing protein n=1 Tax=Flaviflagellibacter deserti TaxID=2267266 RepID=A0ABV9Z565_9HYPH
MNISLRALRYVVATADCGNLTEAAKKLNVSQPSISAALAQVEAELGVQIFVRHHARGVTPTAAGNRIVNDARALLNHARDFATTAQSLGDEVRGEISVGCFWTIATHVMPRLLSTFAEKHPGISVSLDEGDQQHILETLMSGRTEMALAYRLAIPDEVQGELLAELPPYAILHADHPFAGRSEVHLSELVDEDFVMLDLPYSRDYFVGLFHARGIEPRIAFRSRAYELARGLVGHGRGYTITNLVPRTTYTHDGGRVAAVRIAGDPEPIQLMILSLKRQMQRPAVEAFATHLRSAFAAGGDALKPAFAKAG